MHLLFNSKIYIYVEKEMVETKEQHYVSIFLSRLWSVGKVMLFIYKGKLISNQCHFFLLLSSLQFFLLFRFVFVHMRSWCLKLEPVPTDHTNVEKKGCIVLWRRQIFWFLKMKLYKRKRNTILLKRILRRERNP